MQSKQQKNEISKSFLLKGKILFGSMRTRLTYNRIGLLLPINKYTEIIKEFYINMCVDYTTCQ
jgi:hypothetical protein